MSARARTRTFEKRSWHLKREKRKRATFINFPRRTNIKTLINIKRSQLKEYFRPPNFFLRKPLLPSISSSSDSFHKKNEEKWMDDDEEVEILCYLSRRHVVCAIRRCASAYTLQNRHCRVGWNWSLQLCREWKLFHLRFLMGSPVVCCRCFFLCAFS